MRTTLIIDDDVLAHARHEAVRSGTTAGAVISALARIGLSRPAPARYSRAGILLLPEVDNPRPVTLEHVNRLRDALE